MRSVMIKNKKLIINNKISFASTLDEVNFMLLFREFLSYQLSEDQICLRIKSKQSNNA